MEEEKRNLVLFFMVSMIIMIGYPYFSRFFGIQPNVGQSIVDSNLRASSTQKVIFKTKEMFTLPVEEEKPHNITICAKSISGTISTCGIKIQNIFLNKYKETIDESQKVSVFGKDSNNYYAHVGWTSENTGISLPHENTVWKSDGKNEKEVLSEDSPIKLTWDNKSELSFERSISVDNNFMLTVTDTVKNYGTQAIPLRSGTKIHREFDKNTTFNGMSYEGPLGYIDNRLEQISYEDIEKKREIRHKTIGGWFGITDKFWLVSFIPKQETSTSILCTHTTNENKNVYEIHSSGEMILLAPNAELVRTYHLFVGAKEIRTLDMYEDKLGIKHFDLAIDFGWLYLLTKPLLYSLAFAKDTVENMGLGIILITLLIKLLLLPLAHKSHNSMNRMREIQPKIQALQKKYENDKMKLGQEVSAMYTKEGVSPIGGCLPMLLQSPVIIALYRVLQISIEMRHAPFIWWIHDLSLPDPLSVFNLFGLVPITLPGFLQIGVWPILMGLTMHLQQKMSPAPADPTQANMMLIMPLVFTYMFAQVSAGLVIYWTFSNILSILHQYFVMKQEENRKMQKSKAI